MKNTSLLKIGLLAVLLATGMVLTSCNKSDDGGEEPTPAPAPVNPSGATYTLSFDANGGENAPSDVSFADKATIPADGSISRTGYKFLGWSTDKNATEASIKAGDEFSTLANTTLYAVWQKLASLTFDANGGTDSPAVEYFDGKMVLSENATASRKGYTFLGWSTKQDAKEADLQAGDEIKGDAATIYAVWKLNVYTVIFHTNYNYPGNTSTSTFTIKDVEKNGFDLYTWCDGLPEGYTLMGWKEKDSDVVYYIGDTVEILKDADLYPVISKPTTTEERTNQYYDGN